MIPLPCHQAHTHCQSRACAVAADTNVVDINTQLLCMVISPGERGIAVLIESREGILRCQRVQGKYHLAAYFLGIANGITVVVTRCFQHKTTAVKIDQTRCFGGEILGRQDKAGDVLSIVAFNLMGGHIQFLIPPK